MVNMPLASSWSYTVDKLYLLETHDAGFRISLKEVHGVRFKEWFIAYTGTSKANMSKHMESLTDDLCEAFFPKERVKKPKKVTE